MSTQAPAVPTSMSFDEYLAWEAEQEEKWELVDGRPVLRSERWSWDSVTGMAGATYAHNLVVANLIVALSSRLRGKLCRALPSDIKTRSAAGSVRYPDVTVECGAPAPSDLVSSEPRVVFEVLSPSNTLRQQLRLLDDYQSVASLQHIVFLEQGRPAALVWTRDGEVWRRSEIEGLDRSLDLTAIDTELPLADVYDGLAFAEAAAVG